MSNITLAKLVFGNDIYSNPGLEVEPLTIDSDRIVQMTDMRADNEYGPHCEIVYDSPIDGRTTIKVKQLKQTIQFMIRTKMFD